jgi:hypothetical protein
MPDEGNQNHFPYIIFHFSFFIARMFPKETAKAQRKQSTPRKFSVKKLCPRDQVCNCFISWRPWYDSAASRLLQ